eukprot:CAMPEP_0118920798 /NCGR_PEP_ID=MMETSP1169-20130426/229_1 /TAXON_ID=36882 /ORGANISM="Pyramimonas obovata, Strain CCMP722" /LENGTH=117 /DNA_ID=CAMNT_0006861389 /DNA_START=96 /DNA_END=449 /DNA_ORIENTATION=+
MKAALFAFACVMFALPLAQGYNEVKQINTRRIYFLALELVDNRCPSQAAGMLKENRGTSADLDLSSGRKLLAEMGICSMVAQKVDGTCSGAPDDRGAEAVAQWLSALGCYSANDAGL